MNTPERRVRHNKAHSKSNPLKSATDDEHDELYDNLQWAIIPSSTGGTGRQAHIPEDRESDDRDNVETVCYHSKSDATKSRLRRKPMNAYPKGLISFCDYCVKTWRENNE